MRSGQRRHLSLDTQHFFLGNFFLGNFFLGRQDLLFFLPPFFATRGP